MEEQGKETVVSEKEESTPKENDMMDEQTVEQKIESSANDENSQSSEAVKEEPGSEAAFQKEVDALAEENEKLKDRMLRTQAEFENFKRRTQKEKAAERKYKAEELVTELLPILDNFERALQTEISEDNKGFFEGMQMIYNQLKETLKTQGVEKIDTEDKEFDPTYHHAVVQIEDDEIDSNIIVEELQKGYMLKDKVIRPAMVKVNK